jgi:serine/threonine protein kinase/Tol biopolymer transport system component
LPLTPGTRLGVYEVVGVIGAGGMGEVYRAHDPRLNRDVALKVLPDAFANDPLRVARFTREAQTLAALNHSNIAHIHGLEQNGSVLALAMELVEGEDLAERLFRGALPSDEALPIAKQIAEALEAAHEQGIIHRDVKPANIKVSRAGSVKVLDFGLAKLLDPSPEAGAADARAATSTLTSPPMLTSAGVVLGTAAYMAPEQARGHAVDRRADIWAFGCVLYEMLTAKRPFDGETLPDIMAAVIHTDPDWSRLPGSTSQAVRLLLRRCLRKDPRQRLQAIGDARVAIEEVLSGAVPDDTIPARSRWSKWWLASGAAGVLTGAAIAGLIARQLTSFAEPPRPVTRFVITLPPGQQLAAASALALSPDGSQLAYVAMEGATTNRQIFLRAMDGVDAKPIAGSEGASSPFFSPDGQWLGFFAGGRLKKLPLRGGAAVDLADVSNPTGAAWIDEHTIVFASYLSTLLRVSDDGGTPQPLTRFEPGETSHVSPRPLPGGKMVLFSTASTRTSAIAVQRLDSGARHDIIQTPTPGAPDYVGPGYVVYAQAGNLMAATFDAERNRTGAPIAAVPDVLQYSVSATGSLVYVAGKPPAAAQERLVWVSRDGTEQSVGAPPRDYNQPRLSPDGRRVAVDVIERSTADVIESRMQVWLYDLTRESFSPFTFDGSNRHAVWAPDGTRLAFMSNRDGGQQIFWKRADGSGDAEPLPGAGSTMAPDVLNIPYSWSGDGRLLAFARLAPAAAAELCVLHLDDDSSARSGGTAPVFTRTRAADGAPQLSPDGRWMAYASEESGRREIYVQAYPGPGGRSQISSDGGNEPLWSRTGRELFYRSGDRMMSVEIGTQEGFLAGKPRQLFEGPYVRSSAGYVRANYDVSHDGQRFLMLKSVEQKSAPLTQMHVVLNWSDEMSRRLAR